MRNVLLVLTAVALVCLAPLAAEAQTGPAPVPDAGAPAVAAPGPEEAPVLALFQLGGSTPSQPDLARFEVEPFFAAGCSACFAQCQYGGYRAREGCICC